MDLVERLILLGRRQDDEGWYTNANICWAAADEIKRLREVVQEQSVEILRLALQDSLNNQD
jgi:hypothetical protein